MTDSNLSAFEERASKAEQQLSILSEKFDRVSELAETKIKSLEQENLRLQQELQRLQNSGKSNDDVESVRKLFKELRLKSPENQFTNRTSISDIVSRSDQGTGLIGTELTVTGWAKTVRVQGGGRFAFLELNDGSVFRNLQIVVGSEVDGFDKVADVSTGASFLVQGNLVEGKGRQPVELLATKVALLGGCEARVYPLAKKQHTLEHLRSIAHLRPRTNTIGAIARVRNALAFATHLFFNSLGFLYVHTPLITGSDCEGAGEMFSVTTLLKGQGQELKDVPVVPNTTKIDYTKDFFGRPTFLTVSGQLNGENFACALTNIYTFGPTFRAEVSHTTRHLAEFWMIEPEMAFVDLIGNIDYAEAYLKFVVSYALENCREDLEFFDKQYEKGLIDRLKHVLNSPFVRITYTQAIEELIKSGKKFVEQPAWGLDLATEHERFLTDEIYKCPVVVTNYPKDFKAFYMRLNEDGKTVAAMDVLVPKIGEVIGGSQREERLDVLLEQLKARGLPEEAYQGYLDLRRYGSVVHSGFGLGFERLVMFTTGVENIRDVIPFPRWPGHAEF